MYFQCIFWLKSIDHILFSDWAFRLVENTLFRASQRLQFLILTSVIVGQENLQPELRLLYRQDLVNIFTIQSPARLI